MRTARIATALALALAVAVAVPVAAHHDGSYAGLDNWVSFFEDGGYGGDHWVHTKAEDSQIANLNNYREHIFWVCNGNNPPDDNNDYDWNECVSSMKVEINGGWCVRFYRDTAYQNKIKTLKNPVGTADQWYFPDLHAIGEGDHYSAFKFAPWSSDTGTCLFNDGQGG